LGVPFTPTGSIAPATGDLANFVIAGSFTGAAQTSVAACIYGAFNVSIWGGTGENTAWVASIQLEKTFDGGTTWIVAGVGGSGAQAIFNTGQDVAIAGNELERGVGYRLNCTGYTSGSPIHYRISTNGVLATSNGIPS
jgi:hypothetical protein